MALDFNNGKRGKSSTGLDSEALKGRYLRAYLFDSSGNALPSLMKSEKVSNALLPIMKLEGMKSYAGDLLSTSVEPRRDAAIQCLISAQEKAPQLRYPIFGVALLVCPNRSMSAKVMRSKGRRFTLNDSNSYMASFAALGEHNQIWAGDVVRSSLREIENRINTCVSYVRTKTLESLIDFFEKREL